MFTIETQELASIEVYGKILTDVMCLIKVTKTLIDIKATE